MKAKLLAIALLLVPAIAFADDDRFGSERAEVSRTSYTQSADLNVLIASAPVQTYPAIGGEIYLKGVDCFGVAPSTIAFYDATRFDNTVSTRTKFIHIGALAPSGRAQGHTHMPYSMLFSSGLVYTKIGIAPCTITFDFTLTPGDEPINHY